jgi:hypothetical protein
MINILSSYYAASSIRSTAVYRQPYRAWSVSGWRQCEAGLVAMRGPSTYSSHRAAAGHRVATLNTTALATSSTGRAEGHPLYTLVVVVRHGRR